MDLPRSRLACSECAPRTHPIPRRWSLRWVHARAPAPRRGAAERGPRGAPDMGETAEITGVRWPPQELLLAQIEERELVAVGGSGSKPWRRRDSRRRAAACPEPPPRTASCRGCDRPRRSSRSWRRWSARDYTRWSRACDRGPLERSEIAKPEAARRSRTRARPAAPKPGAAQPRSASSSSRSGCGKESLLGIRPISWLFAQLGQTQAVDHRDRGLAPGAAASSRAPLST